jgi:alkanesulfonate monooxygenase SsuD/methylene tetrahydromethanopterin reductase-like flavin-dependent oxidoreductase (luciferase family)
MVQFSFRPPNADYLGFQATPEGIVESACKAEELEFDAVLVNDHIIVDGTPQFVASWGNTYDPLMVLSYVAACTTRIRLGTSVLIMPYRNPVATAKPVKALRRRWPRTCDASDMRPAWRPSRSISTVV